MTWEELKEYAKSKGASIYKDSDDIYFSNLCFSDDGGIYLDGASLDTDEITEVPCISSDRTIEEMYNIIQALVLED